MLKATFSVSSPLETDEQNKEKQHKVCVNWEGNIPGIRAHIYATVEGKQQQNATMSQELSTSARPFLLHRIYTCDTKDHPRSKGGGAYKPWVWSVSLSSHLCGTIFALQLSRRTVGWKWCQYLALKNKARKVKAPCLKVWYIIKKVLKDWKKDLKACKTFWHTEKKKIKSLQTVILL